MDEMIQGFSPVSMPVTTSELIRELTSVIDEKTDKAVNVIPAKSITITTSDENLQVGQSVKLGIQSTPTNANNPIVVWESSDPEIAIVTSDGIVFAEKVGEVNIIATDAETGTITNTITIKVSETGSEEGGGEDPEPGVEEGDVTTESGENIITEDGTGKIIAENV